MAGDFAIIVQGLKNLDKYKSYKKDIDEAMSRAINKVAPWARKAIADDISEQVAFPKDYLSSGSKRLYVRQFAKKGDLEAIITARGRPTSLARFAKGSSVTQKGVVVEVSPGKAHLLKGAFLIRLPAGKANIETKSNMGLAVRLKPGQALRNKTKSVRMKNGLYLLYGPSINQVFRAESGKGAATDAVPSIEARLQAEFFRQMEL